MPITHKIPQNVTKYESKIIGNFTPRQFIYLAIGGLAIMLFFMLPFPGVIRIGAVLIIAPITVLMAIVSFQGRRTDTWLVMFLQAASRPTLRKWVKEAIPPEVLLPSYVVPHTKTTQKTRSTTDLEEFLGFWRTQEVKKDYTDEEKAFLQRVALLSKNYDLQEQQKTDGVQKPLAQNTPPSLNQDNPPIPTTNQTGLN